MVIELSGVQFGLYSYEWLTKSPICLITSMITDWIGGHKVLLLINHNYNQICDILGFF